ncbi:MAG: YihA family ribosome biogenesis GTP-binding protein [Verrucomicrobia bacterium]|nr:YihA family ribosome biogenesis GTP-binding protein [Verrucomicrobiota bacterium]
MKSFDWRKAQFIKTAILPEHYPKIKGPSGKLLTEIAVAGRSNVGKSTLLNDLFHSKKLVKTSSTPGKTQGLSYFSVDDSLIFVDLPGYGYAKVPPEVKKQWGPMVQTYLEESKSLALILFLLDIRRLPNEEDLQFLKWAAWTKIPIVIIFSKIDKLLASEREKATQAILKQLPFDNLTYLHHSSKTHQGTLELQRLIIKETR